MKKRSEMKPIMRQIRFIKVKKVGFYLAGMTALCDGTLKPEVNQKMFFYFILFSNIPVV